VFASGHNLPSRWHIFAEFWDRQDGVGPGLQFRLDLRSYPSLGLPALYRMRSVATTALGDAPIEHDLDAVVGSEAFTKVRVQIGVLTGDDEQRAPHLSLVQTAGNCACVDGVMRGHFIRMAEAYKVPIKRI
jgi:hypothetical protein